MSTVFDKKVTLINQLQWLGQVTSTESALFHQAAAAKQGLHVTDMKALRFIMQSDALTAGQLAKQLNLSTGAITSVIDRLEKARAVTRQHDPQDRRKIIIVPNKQRIAEGSSDYMSMGKAFEKLYQTYSLEQLQFLVDYYTTTVEIVQQEIIKVQKLTKE